MSSRVAAAEKETCEQERGERTQGDQAGAVSCYGQLMAGYAHFSPRLFQFLKQLAKNNDRVWFQANKLKYERDVKEPLLSFIGDFAGPLRKLSPHLVADPRPTGGSMFRIYRDTRFSKDKQPYKTVAAAQFRHDSGKDVHGPGLYLHLEPGNVFIGAGIYRPEPAVANRIRDAIAADTKAWTRAITGAAFSKCFALSGESLKRPPRGFDPEHPRIEDLKRKDFIAVMNFTDKQACSPDFMKQVASAGLTAKPLMKFLCDGLELEF